jgi:hypothetical protein
MNLISATKQSSILEEHYKMWNPLQALHISLANVMRMPEGGQGHMFHFFFVSSQSSKDQYTDFNLAAEIE